jgi:hypothetical protein
MLPGGLGDYASAADFDPKQIAKGVKVEMEHTIDPKKAKEIALDHLTEDPFYYDKLEMVESNIRIAVSELDGLSDHLQKLGFEDLALRIDVVTNTLEAEE